MFLFLEPHGISCALDWRDIPDSYIITIFTTEYVLPLLIMLYCYINILHIICQRERGLKTLRRKRKGAHLTKVGKVKMSKISKGGS